MKKIIIGFVITISFILNAEELYGPTWVKKCNSTSNLAYCEQRAKSLKEASDTKSVAEMGNAFGKSMNDTMAAWDAFSPKPNQGKSVGEYATDSIAEAIRDEKSLSGIPLASKYFDDAIDQLMERVDDNIDESKKGGSSYYHSLKATVLLTKAEFLLGFRPEKDIVEKNMKKGRKLIDELIEFDKEAVSVGSMSSKLPKLKYYKGILFQNGEGGLDKDPKEAFKNFSEVSEMYDTWANDENREIKGLKAISPYDSEERFIFKSLAAVAAAYIAGSGVEKNITTADEFFKKAAIMASRLRIREDGGAVWDSINKFAKPHRDEQERLDNACPVPKDQYFKRCLLVNNVNNLM